MPSQHIHVDQIGYPCHGGKRAVTDSGNSFSLISLSTGKSVYEGSLICPHPAVDPLSGDVCRIADFSSVTAPGRYLLRLDSGEESFPFAIGNDLYQPIRVAAQRMLYYQRCGCDLTEKYAGKFHRPACHRYPQAYAFRISRDPDCRERSTPTDRYVELTGGWHEAGDFCKQIASGVCTVLLLLNAWRMFPEVFGAEAGIPESGNGVPDVLNEARWELEWLLKMQEPESGGVYFTTFAWTHPSVLCLPQDDTSTYYVYPPALESTAMLAQAMALASRVYRAFDTAFADRCLSSAERAWDYLEAHAADGACYGRIGENGYGVTMGIAGRAPDIMRYGAAAELSVTTGKKRYTEALRSLAASQTDLLNFYMMDLTGFGTMTCLLGDTSYRPDPETEAILREAVFRVAAQDYAITKETGYEIPLDDFTGQQTNQVILRRGMQMILAQRLDPTLDYTDAIANTLHYFLGQNAVDYCMISGFGSQSPLHYHARQAENDGIEEPLPGFVVFGPFSYDTQVKKKTGVEKFIPQPLPPMKCYVDVFPLFRLNEVEIDTNTYPIFVTAYLQSLEKINIKRKERKNESV